MAKKNFNFGDSPVAKTAEDIRNEKHVAPAETATVKPESTQTAPVVTAVAEEEPTPKAKKTEVGVTIQMPKKYYRLLRDIKDETGTPLRDLALKAVIDFVDAYQFE